MRRGNILEGIRAGFQAYMQGRQFGAQMDYSKLQQEQMGLANQIMQQRQADYMSPEEQAAFERTQTLATDKARYEQRQPWESAAADEAERRRREGLEWNISKGIGVPSGAETKPYKFKDVFPVYEHFNQIAVDSGLPMVSTETMSEIQGYLQNYGETGMALGRAAVIRDSVMDNKQNSDWLMQLQASAPDRYQHTRDAIFQEALRGRTIEQIQTSVVDPIMKQVTSEGLVQGHGGWGKDILDPQVEELAKKVAESFMKRAPTTATWGGRR